MTKTCKLCGGSFGWNHLKCEACRKEHNSLANRFKRRDIARKAAKGNISAIGVNRNLHGYFVFKP